MSTGALAQTFLQTSMHRESFSIFDLCKCNFSKRKCNFSTLNVEKIHLSHTSGQCCLNKVDFNCNHKIKYMNQLYGNRPTLWVTIDCYNSTSLISYCHDMAWWVYFTFTIMDSDKNLFVAIQDHYSATTTIEQCNEMCPRLDTVLF